jgi:protein-S-isoprenylcysteine O-methyltransferase Ste14
MAMTGVALLGFSLSTWALTTNSFCSATVCIQEDRGQYVVTTGPYRAVRHPGYAGAVLFNAGVAFMLGSTWCLIPFGILCVAVVVRTAMEDRILRSELPGYIEYCTETRYRLFPGIW